MESQESSNKCNNCGTLNSAKSKFCKKCGATLLAIEKCPQCGDSLDKDSVFCQECGSAIRKPQTMPSTMPTQNPSFRRLPFGLELLIALGAIGALFYFASAVMAFWALNAIFRGASGELASTIGAMGFVWLLISFLQAGLAFSLWKLRDWARKVVMGLFLFGLIGAFLNPIYGITSIVYNAIVLWYLNSARIRALFSSGTTFNNKEQLAPSLGVLGVASFATAVCPSCGKKSKPGERFCKKCGHEL